MTPEEWGRCDDPDQMLEYLGGRADHRRLRLFVAACCRRIWPLLSNDGSKQAVEVAERYADGKATAEESAAAAAAAWAAREPVRAARKKAGTGEAASAARAATAWAAGTMVGEAKYAAWAATLAANAAWAARKGGSEGAERQAQARLLRCVFADPFRPAPAVPPAALAYAGGTARGLAEVIYLERRFEDLPVLADLLEEAGSTDAGLLGHLRGPGPHCLGCWALDAVIGKS
jgi:hypothetical protein